MTDPFFPKQAELHSEITCPQCGHRRVEQMPTDACQYFYECEACRTLLRPRAGDCCGFFAVTAPFRARRFSSKTTNSTIIAVAADPIRGRLTGRWR